MCASRALANTVLVIVRNHHDPAATRARKIRAKSASKPLGGLRLLMVALDMKKPADLSGRAWCLRAICAVGYGLLAVGADLRLSPISRLSLGNHVYYGARHFQNGVSTYAFTNTAGLSPMQSRSHTFCGLRTRRLEGHASWRTYSQASAGCNAGKMLDCHPNRWRRSAHYAEG